jgi:hypothetical protein
LLQLPFSRIPGWSPFLTDEEEISASDLHSSAPWPDA